MAGRSLKNAIQVCAAKRRFNSMADVLAAAKPGLTGYHCVACGGFHLTSQNGAAPVRERAEERKPTFEPSVLGRAKLIRPVPKSPERRRLIGECVAKANADGRVKVRIEGKEFQTTNPVQPAQLRSRLGPGTKVTLNFCPKPLLIQILTVLD